MKRLFNPIRAFVYLRIVVAGSCVLTAAALAFVATANSNSATPSSKPISEKHSKDTILWANENYDRSGDPDAVGDPTQAAEPLDHSMNRLVVRVDDREAIRGGQKCPLVVR